MSHFCPAYPKPPRNKLSRLLMFFRARRSWMDGLSQHSYRMQMGEVHLPGVDLYMVNQPSLVRQVLVEQPHDFPKSALLGDALRPLLGDSIFTTNSEQWRRQRDMMEPAFAHARMDVAFPRMLDATEALLQRLRTMPPAAEHDIELEMTHVTADIIFRTIFSVPMDGEDARRIFAAFARYQRLAPRLMLPAIYGVRWLVWPWQRAASKRAASEIRDLLARLVKPRFDAQRSGKPPPHQDILQAFMEARDPATGVPFDFEELVNQVAMLFLAGHETSASALSWALHLLAHAPDIQERMHGEVQEALADRRPQPGDMKRMELTWNVFRETLRLFPPVGFIAREAAHTCVMRDKKIPAGASVVISPWLIQRHRKLWSDPDSFNPDRHANDASREMLRNAYLPFGMGQRVCMGANFALQEATLILASVVRAFRVRPVPGHVPQPVGRLTIRSANGVRLIIEQRACENIASRREGDDL